MLIVAVLIDVLSVIMLNVVRLSDVECCYTECH
jgi:hypothetical protein